MTWFEPRRLGLIPRADRTTDARTVTAEDASAAVGELTEYAQAADRLRTERANRVEVQGTIHQICRIRRLMRWGPDGPEGPRPSDISSHPPEQMHPLMDEDGNTRYDDEDEKTRVPMSRPGLAGVGWIREWDRPGLVLGSCCEKGPAWDGEHGTVVAWAITPVS